MTWKTGLLVMVSFATILFAGIAAEDAGKSHKLQSVSLRKMADSLHAVIAADRQTYSELVVQRLATNGSHLASAEKSRDLNSIPVHAELLRRSATAIQQRGAEFSYTLRSLWALTPGSGPQTQAEEVGLQAVAKNPDQPFYTEEELGGRSYYTAIYADRATLSSCVSCHNQHPRSPRNDFRVGDVMGAIVVRVPLEF